MVTLEFLQAGMRDRVLRLAERDYIGVDLEVVWAVLSARIPELQATLESFLADPGSSDPV